MRIINQVIILIIFISFNSILAQNKDILAKVGDRMLTTQEFRERIEMTPYLNKGITQKELKERFLFTLIQEKLWAEFAKEKGYTNSPLIKYSLSEIEKMYTRDELYQREVMQKVNISDDEINSYTGNCRKILYMNYLNSENKSEIDSLYNLLQSGKSFTEVLAKRPESQLQPVPIKVECGQASEEREYLFYSLIPGKYSKPVKTETGWTIFYLKEIEINTKMTDQDVKAKAKKVIEQRKYAPVYKEFNRKYLSGKQVVVKDDLFYKLVNILQQKLENKLSSNENKQTQLAALDFYDIYSALNSFTEKEKNSPFILFKNNPVKLKDYVGALGFRGIKIKNPEGFNLKNYLANEIKNYIRLEIIYRESVKRGYNKLPSVREQVSMWKDNYLAQFAKSKIEKDIKIADWELKKFYNQINLDSNAVWVRTSKVVSKNLDRINDIIQNLSNDPDLERAYQNLLLKDGVRFSQQSDFVNLKNMERYGFTASSKIGDVTGPFFEDDNFILFQLIDKKSKSAKDSIYFESAKEGIKQELYFRKLKDLLNSKTVELANKYGVQIDFKKLGGIKVHDLNIVVMKFFGLGEQILAVPFTNQFYEWYDMWNKKEVRLP